MENSHRIEMLQKKNKKLKMYTTDQELVNYIQPVAQSLFVCSPWAQNICFAHEELSNS